MVVAALSLLGSALSSATWRGIVYAIVPTWFTHGVWLICATEEMFDVVWLAPSWHRFWTFTVGKILLPGSWCLALGLLGTAALLRWRVGIRAWAARYAPAQDPLFAGCRAPGRITFSRPWRQGFLRLIVDAVPGDAIAPAFVLIALAATNLSFLVGDPIHYHRWLLLGAASFACFLGLGQATALGYASVGGERDAGTWELLLSTGIRSATLLSSRLATAFHGLSAEWTWTLPAWLLTAIITRDPAVLPLALLQSASIVTGFPARGSLSSCGFWRASISTRPPGSSAPSTTSNQPPSPSRSPSPGHSPSPSSIAAALRPSTACCEESRELPPRR